MADVSGVQQELGLHRESIDFVHCGLQGGDHVGISRLVESHVAVADLYEAEFSNFAGLHRRAAMRPKGVRFQHASLHYTEGAGASPGHALQKTSAVDSIVI